MDLTLWQFLVAILMGIGSLGIFVWAVLSGMFHDVEDIKMRAYHAEVDDDEPESDQRDQQQ
jgi:cbb3-type cytochrome oxidase maturation protein